MPKPTTTFRYSSRGQIPWSLGYVLLAFSLLCLGSLGFYELRLLFQGNVTTGHVSRIERRLSTTFVYVKFRTTANQAAEFRWPLAMRERFEVGQQVRIRYLAARTSLGRILSFHQWWLAIIVKSALGLGCGWGGFVMLWPRSLLAKACHWEYCHDWRMDS